MTQKNWVKIIRENFFAKSPSAAADSSYQLSTPFASFMIRVDCNKIIKTGFMTFIPQKWIGVCVSILLKSGQRFLNQYLSFVVGQKLSK
jgi:hypothetical protein